MLLMRAPADEALLSCLPPSAQDRRLESLKSAIKNCATFDYGISAEATPTIAEGYARALIFRVGRSVSAPVQVNRIYGRAPDTDED